MITIDTATQMSNPALLSGVARLAAEGRHAVADLIALLPALEERKLYAAEGYASLFRFCVGRLHLSEEEAYYRIAAGRVAARFPVVLERLREGRLTLTAVALLRPHLTGVNHEQLLAAAEGRSKREVQVLVAALAPRPDVPTSLRKLPAPRASAFARRGARDAAAAALSCGAATDRCSPELILASSGEDPAEPRRFGHTTSLANVPPADRDQRVSAGGLVSGSREGLQGKSPDLLANDLLAGAAATPLETAPDVVSGGPAVTVAASDAVMSVPAIASPVPPPRPAEICPLAPSRYSLRLTISEDTYAKLQRAQDLLRHAEPNGDLAAVLDRALTLLVTQLERQKAGAPTTAPKASPPPVSGRPRRNRAAAPLATAAGAPTFGEAIPPASATAGPRQPPRSSQPAPGRRSRHIAAAVRRDVWRRDGGRCSYVAPDGHRCTQTSRLEFHHTVPFAEGGEATPETVAVLCTTHNRWEAQRWFGEEVTTYRGRQDEKRDGQSRHPGWPKLRPAGIPSLPGDEGISEPGPRAR